MKRIYLGEFEEVVLLTVAMLGDAAYGVSIADAIEDETGRTVSISAVHATLHRLEEKKMLLSQMGESTAERGGRRKRIFTVTVLGNRTMNEIRAIRNRMWESISLQRFSVMSI